MSRRRPPRSPWQRLDDGKKAQRTLGAGSVVNAAPILPRSGVVANPLEAVADVTQRGSKIDQFTLPAGGAQDVALTYLPIADSWNVTLFTGAAGRACRQTTDYTVSGQTLSLTTGQTPLTSDVLQVQYDYLTGQPTQFEQAEVLFRWDGAAAPSTSTGNQPWSVANGSFFGGNQRNGSGSGNGWDSSCHAHKTVTAKPTLACGMALRSAATSGPYNWTADTDGDDFGMMSFCADSGATCHIYLDWNGSNQIRAYRGQRGTLLATSGTAMPNSTPGQWVYVIAEVKIHDTTGYVKVWQDGALVINFTGDTKNGGTATNLDTVKVGGFWPQNLFIDDLYIATQSIGDPGDVTSLTIG